MTPLIHAISAWWVRSVLPWVGLYWPRLVTFSVFALTLLILTFAPFGSGEEDEVEAGGEDEYL